MNPLKHLNDYGQVIWLDFLSRRFIADGSLKRLIDEDGLAGVTSNPSIFEKAIVSSSDYDASLEAADRQGKLDERALFERVAVEDIQAAADVLRPVYEATRRRDGYVSIEVSPYLAMRTEETVAEARRLWHAVGRENLMIKVPATTPGLPAIHQLTAEGINVNITLLFSQKVYEDVVEAYLKGSEDLIARGGNPARIASVASFFVSRIDTAVDKLLEVRLGKAVDNSERLALTSAHGKVAIANAQTGWFVESLLTQTLIIHIIRTAKVPFVGSRASTALITTSLIIVVVGIAIPFSSLGPILGFVRLPPSYWLAVVVILMSYAVLTHIMKTWFVLRFGLN
jgi:transaldolase/glucose-6-phosphate isomerase